MKQQRVTFTPHHGMVCRVQLHMVGVSTALYWYCTYYWRLVLYSILLCTHSTALSDYRETGGSRSQSYRLPT